MARLTKPNCQSMTNRSAHASPPDVGTGSSIHPSIQSEQPIYLSYPSMGGREEERKTGRRERAMISEAPGQAAYLVETVDAMEATATNLLLLPLRQRRRWAVSGEERQSATSLRRSAILEGNGMGREAGSAAAAAAPAAAAAWPSRDWDVRGGAWWWRASEQTNGRERGVVPRAICTSHTGLGSGAWVLAASASPVDTTAAAADAAGRHSAVGPRLCLFLRATERNYLARPHVPSSTCSFVRGVVLLMFLLEWGLRNERSRLFAS